MRPARVAEAAAPAFRLSARTLEILANVVCGSIVPGRDSSVSPYRTGAQLEALARELVLEADGSLPRPSRHVWTLGWVTKWNGTPSLKRIVEIAVRPADYVHTAFDPGQAAEYLNSVLEHDGCRLVRRGKAHELTAWADESGTVEPAHPVLSEDYVRDLSTRAQERLAAGEYDGAITLARTRLEAVLAGLEDALAIVPDHAGHLPKQYRKVVQALGIDAGRKELDEGFRKVASGLVQVVEGLSTIRNRMSDSHARKATPAPHHAEAVVNASRTVAAFLVASYEFQQKRRGAAQKKASE